MKDFILLPPENNNTQVLPNPEGGAKWKRHAFTQLVEKYEFFKT